MGTGREVKGGKLGGVMNKGKEGRESFGYRKGEVFGQVGVVNPSKIGFCCRTCVVGRRG